LRHTKSRSEAGTLYVLSPFLAYCRQHLTILSSFTSSVKSGNNSRSWKTEQFLPNYTIVRPRPDSLIELKMYVIVTGPFAASRRVAWPAVVTGLVAQVLNIWAEVCRPSGQAWAEGEVVDTCYPSGPRLTHEVVTTCYLPGPRFVPAHEDVSSSTSR
jgi:hypothetical protein